MKDKRTSRKRRLKRTRKHIARLEVTRLDVFRTPQHIYAQVTASEGGKILAAASTVEKEVKARLKVTGNIDAATEIGRLVAERAIAAGVKKVAFDRGGFKYHGRIKALADAARDGGMEF